MDLLPVDISMSHDGTDGLDRRLACEVVTHIFDHSLSRADYLSIFQLMLRKVDLWYLNMCLVVYGCYGIGRMGRRGRQHGEGGRYGGAVKPRLEEVVACFVTDSPKCFEDLSCVQSE